MQQEIGDRIRSSRERLGFSQRQLALKSGVNKEVVSKYERGEVQEPSVIALNKLSEALRVPNVWLCFGPKLDHAECDNQFEKYLIRCKTLSLEQKCYVIATLERIVTLDEFSKLANSLQNSSFDSYSIL